MVKGFVLTDNLAQGTKLARRISRYMAEIASRLGDIRCEPFEAFPPHDCEMPEGYRPGSSVVEFGDALLEELFEPQVMAMLWVP